MNEAQSPLECYNLTKKPLKKLAEKVSLDAKVKQVQEVCDFCQKDHPNGHCIPEGTSEEAK
ncbi:hypothetical protein A2U01_0071137, partial [Trifolium medium]|nr:hypothetical protein [Trifolium medium]